jgi:glycosyltransferase involved in cell wall biosynthesis
MIFVSHLTTVHSAKDVRVYQRFSKGIHSEVGGVRILHCGECHDSAEDGVQFVEVDKRRNRFGRIVISSLKILLKARKYKSDVYHIHDPELFWISMFMPRKSITVIDFHENYSKKIQAKEWIPKGLRMILTLLYQASLVFLVPGRVKVIAAAESVIDGMPRRMSREAVVVRNLPAWNGSSSAIEAIRGNSVAGSEGLSILYTGGITEFRGIENVIKAVAQYGGTDWKLTIIGRKNEALYARLGEYFQDERIRYYGEVTYEESLNFQRNADVGVVCNLPLYDYDKALPNKLFEYLSFGIPVVCSNFELWRAIVAENNVGSVCDPEDLSSIADSIKAVRNMLVLDEGVRQRCVDLIKEKYSWENEKKVLLEVYDVI